MFCPKCGTQILYGNTCPNCGWTEETYYSPYSGGNNYVTAYSLRDIFVSPNFLAICILVSAGTLLSLMAGSFNIFGILFSIALWMIYGHAYHSNYASLPSGLKFASGITRAIWIVNWVIVGCLACCALLAMLGVSTFFNYFNGFNWAIPFKFSGQSIAYSQSAYPYGLFGAAVGAVLAFAFLIAAVGMTLVNIFFIGNSCKTTRSLYTSCTAGGGYVEKAHTVRIWLFVIGILSCLSIFRAYSDGYGSSVYALSGCCFGAAYILLSLILKKYFDQPVQS